MAGVIGALKDMSDVVEEMARLQLDLMAAYEVMMTRTKSRTTLEALRATHDGHVQRWKDLAIELRHIGRVPPLPGAAEVETGNDVSHSAQHASNVQLLASVRENELESQRLYERWGRSAVVPVRLRYLFRSCLASARRHHSWLDAATPQLAGKAPSG